MNILFASMALVATALLSNGADAQSLSDKNLVFYLAECAQSPGRKTVVMLDRDILERGDHEIVDTLISADGQSGVLGRDSLEVGESFHVLVFRSSKPGSLFDYHFRGCMVGRISRSKAPGRDLEDLAGDRFVDQTVRFRRALRALTSMAPREQESQKNNDAVAMVRIFARGLVGGDVPVRLIIFGNPFLKRKGVVPREVTEGDIGS